MPFPPSPRTVFDKNPLSEVICELRFPTILEIATERPALFQKSIRDRYPLYEEPTGDPVLTGLPEEIANVVRNFPGLPASHGLHKFTTEDKRTTIRITSDSVSVDTSNYTEWDEFRKQIELALEAMERHYKPAFYTRIGLRYQNVIIPDEIGLEDTDWAALLRPAVAGILAADDVRSDVKSYMATAELQVANIDGGLVRVRYGIATEEGSDRRAFVVDADFFTERKKGANDVIGILTGFNGHAGSLFRWFVTEQLQSALGSR